MSARKPLHRNCTGDIDCRVRGHVRQGTGSWAKRRMHEPLTPGQRETLRERREDKASVAAEPESTA